MSSQISWPSDAAIVQRHFTRIGMRYTSIAIIGTAAIPVAVRLAARVIGKYKDVVIEGCNADVAQQPPLADYADKVLECVDEPQNKFGGAVIDKFGGEGGLFRRMYSWLGNYVLTGVVAHCYRLSSLHLLDRLSGIPSLATTGLSLGQSSFPSYIAAYDFSASAQLAMCGKVLFLLPRAVSQLILPEPIVCANLAIGKTEIAWLTCELTPADLARWELVYIVPFAAVSLGRVIRFWLLRAAGYPDTPRPYSAMISNKAPAVKSTGRLLLDDALLVALRVGAAYLGARYGPKLYCFTGIPFMDKSLGAAYWWSAIASVAISMPF